MRLAGRERVREEPPNQAGGMKLLIVDDDPGVIKVLRRSLEAEGYQVSVASTGQDAIEIAKREPFDSIILDIVLEDLDGFQVCTRLRQAEVWTPILLITGVMGTVESIVQGLDAGADDFLTKPFKLSELGARVRALTRRQAHPRPAQLVVGDLVLDPSTRRVTRGGVPIDLSAREFALLHLFMRHQGEVLSRSEILDRVWGFNYVGVSNVVDVYVRYLRQKIDRPFGVTSLETVRGAGYLLAPPLGG